MRETLLRYGGRIARGEINPHTRWDGRSGFILDADNDNVPLALLSFGIWRLGDRETTLGTGQREHAVLLVGGTLRLQAADQTIDLARPDGPFAGYPGASRACCVYVPRRISYSIQGEGEVAVFAAPAADDMPLRAVTAGETASRGAAVWRRDVVTLLKPGETSTNLVVGETHSPPGLWSGTPPHTHDLADPEGGQSDHEEVYCFRIRRHDPNGAPGGVQFLYGAEGLDEVYSLSDWSVVALPGGCHPVVAGPASELLYVWGMASREPQPLRLRDAPAAAFLKDVETAFQRLTESAPRRRIDAGDFDNVVAAHGLDEHGRRTLTLLLREYGFDIEA